MTTIIDIKPWRNGWKVFECSGAEPVFLTKEHAVDYAKGRANFRSGEIRLWIPPVSWRRRFRLMKGKEAVKPVTMETVVLDPGGGPNLIGQFGRLGSGQNWLSHLEVYLAGPPSRGQEIDGKLQSNSR